MKSQISSREDVEEILRGLEERLAEPVQVLIIGGAAMLELGLKDVTKDIDLVCRDAAGKARLLEAARSLGFELFGPEMRHARLGLDRIAIKGGHTLDILPAGSPMTSSYPRPCGREGRGLRPWEMLK